MIRKYWPVVYGSIEGIKKIAISLSASFYGEADVCFRSVKVLLSGIYGIIDGFGVFTFKIPKQFLTQK